MAVTQQQNQRWHNRMKKRHDEMLRQLDATWKPHMAGSSRNRPRMWVPVASWWSSWLSADLRHGQCISDTLKLTYPSNWSAWKRTMHLLHLLTILQGLAFFLHSVPAQVIYEDSVGSLRGCYENHQLVASYQWQLWAVGPLLCVLASRHNLEGSSLCICW